MRPVAVFLSWLLFCAATAPADAQTPSTDPEVVPVGDHVTGEMNSRITSRPLHVQPVTSERSPVRIMPLRSAPSRREGARPPVVVDESLGASEVEEVGTVSPIRKAGSGVAGFPDRYALVADSTLVVPAEAGLLKNDLDADGEELAVVSFNSSQTEGDLALFSDGRLTYVPPEGFTGTDSFTYRMRDASFNLSEDVTVSIDVYEANRSPIGLSDNYVTLTGTTLAITGPAGLLSNDLDLDGEALTVVSFNSSQTEGDLALFSDGRLTYVPPEGFTGTDSFTYRMRDASFNLSDDVTVSIDVYEGNQPPNGLPDTYITETETPFSIAAAAGVLSNDFDAEDEALSVSSTSTNTTQGAVDLSADGSFVYKPPSGFTGTDTFQYKVQDAFGHESDFITVTILIAASGTTPIGAEDIYATAMDRTLSVSAEAGLLSNDLDLDGEALTVIVFDQSQTEGDLSVFSDGRITYTPPEDFTGTDTFRYRMRDASFNQSDYIPVTIEVLATNRAPVGTDDTYSMLAGMTLSISAEAGLLKNDLDPDREALTVIVFDQSQTEGDLAVFADGRITYTPPEDFTGTDTFRYRMRDASFNQSDYIPVTIDVYEGNRPPIGTEDVYAILMDTPLSITEPAAGLLSNDLDLDGEDLTVVLFSQGGVLGALSLFANGRLTYTPPEGFTGTESFTYRMRDASSSLSDNIPVTIEVLDPKEPPLPVELVSFEAQVKGETVVLRWTTLTETNNAGFEIEQQTDSTWAQVGFVEGFGTTEEPHEYVYRIDAVVPGRYAFRLKQIDHESGFAYGPEVEVHIRPMAFRLAANYPNPFTPSTTIPFEVPESVSVRVAVYDVLGRMVATLVDKDVDAGRHDVVWDGRDASGRPVASGLYFYQMSAGSFSQTHRMMLVR